MPTEKVNALALRQSLGKILARLQRNGKPILVEKDRKPAAVLITLEDYQRRFVDRMADDERRALVASIEHLQTTAQTSTVQVLRDLRGPLP